MPIFSILAFACNVSGKDDFPGINLHRLDLSQFSKEQPNRKINLLFIHHSVGAALLAEPGAKSGEYCLYDTHPEGGGLKRLLIKNNYSVHEATYNSKLGQDTDINHWRAKFTDHMDLVLKTKRQDILLDDNNINRIIVFKSCYPNNYFTGDGESPGNPDSPERTIWNAKSSYNSLLPLFAKYPNILFVAVTAPPMVKPFMNKYKEFFYNIIGKGTGNIGERARIFNNWLADNDKGWLSNYKYNNVVVFDLYDILTGNGSSNWTKYPTKNGKDSHPNRDGNTKTAHLFIDFINQAIIYSGIKFD